MIWEVKMPRLDEDMVEGTVTKWLKNEGEMIQKGEPIAEIETQKVNFAIEAPGSGMLRMVFAKEGDLLPINSIMAIIAAADEDIGAYTRIRSEEENMKMAQGNKGAPTIIAKSAPSSADRGRILISPMARKLAQEGGLDISKIKGTGPEGRITKEDVLNYQAAEKPLTGAGAGRKIARILPFSGMRKSISDRMLQSWRISPRAEHFLSVDVTECLTWREKFGDAWEKQYQIRPSLNDMVIAAAAKALRMFPMVNASLREDRIEIYEDVNVGIAVALEKGLITPVIRQADSRDIFEIALESRQLTELVKRGEHTKETISEGTFTITNLGMFGIDFFVPIINPPESAILAVGEARKTPVVIQDAIGIRSIMRLCLAYDHRLLDGVVAAQFLKSIKVTLENPHNLFPQWHVSKEPNS
jgi:pyruvate dehydrogenase E2 component (dihydrolipoamide acetyltransferase)